MKRHGLALFLAFTLLLMVGCQKCYLCGDEINSVYFQNGTDSVSVLVFGDTANSIECYHLHELGYSQYNVIYNGTPEILECDEKRMEYKVYLGYRCVADY